MAELGMLTLLVVRVGRYEPNLARLTRTEHCLHVCDDSDLLRLRPLVYNFRNPLNANSQLLKMLALSRVQTYFRALLMRSIIALGDCASRS
jgi:hypothetical protein